MNCPRCNRATTLHTHKGVEIDQCESCGGVFLDRGELNRLAEPVSGDLEYSTLHDESFQHDDEFGPIACPRCEHDPMGKVEFNVHTGIILDYCGGCGGFWLDGREMERVRREIRELSEPTEPGDSPAIQWIAQFLFGLPR